MLYHIVAAAKNHIIGKANKIPWNFDEIPAYFEKITARGTAILGRKAYEMNGAALPGCDKFVLSKSHPDGGENPRYFKSLGEALGAVKTPDVFIGGGAELYRQTLPFADGVYRVCIDETYEGDVFYPPLPGSFKEQSRVLLREEPKIEAVFYQNISVEKCGCCHE